MNVPPIPAPRLHRLSVWQLVISVIGLVLTLFSLMGIGILALLARSNSEFAGIDVSILSKFIWVLLFAVLLTIPSIVLSIRRISGKQSAPVWVHNRDLIIASFLIILWVGCLWLGYKAEAWNLPGIVSSLSSIGVVVLPIFLWLTIGRYKLSVGSQQRSWGLLNFSVFVTAPVITLVEMLFVLIIAGIGISSFLQNSDLLPYLQVFQSQGQLDQTALNSLMSEFTPILNQPGFYVVVVLIFCLIVPIIEELLKPLSLWAFAGHSITPAEGWAAGMLCGAAFGVVESLSMMNLAGSEIWFTTAIGRVGTGILHVLTAGLSGYALAKTWQDRHFLRISLVYLAVILLHGCWNFFAILMGVNQMVLPVSLPDLSVLMSVSTWVLGSLALLMAVGIGVINYLLRKQQYRLQSVPPVLPAFQAEPEEQTASSH